jgi:hypothetical protein
MLKRCASEAHLPGIENIVVNRNQTDIVLDCEGELPDRERDPFKE